MLPRYAWAVGCVCLLSMMSQLVGHGVGKLSILVAAGMLG